MRHWGRGSVALWVAGVGLAMSASSALGSAELTDVWRPGTHWLGDDVSETNLRGRVVLIEDWGYR